MTKQVVNTKILIVHLIEHIMHTSNLNVLYVIDNPMKGENDFLFLRLQFTNGCANLRIMRNTTALYITKSTRSNASINTPLVIIVMRIVNDTRFLLSRLPGEGCIALCTPHLIAALNLGDQSATTRATTTILGKELGGRKNFGLTHMLGILRKTLNLVTLGTRPLTTETTLPRSTQKAAALCIRTLLSEDIL